MRAPANTTKSLKCYRSNQPEIVMPQYLKYHSVQKWIRQQKKKSANLESGGIPYDTMTPMCRALDKYCLSLGRNPDEFIEDAKASVRLNGSIDEINDVMDKWWETSTSDSDPAILNRPYPKVAVTVARQFYATLKGFYKANGIVITAKTPTSPKIRKNTLIPTSQQIKAMCSVAPIQHSSWILANNYIGLRITSVTELTVKDFNTDNWNRDLPLYPVHISKEVCGFFEYTQWIGHDAMERLRTYFDKEGFRECDHPWPYDRGWMNKMFKKYAYDAKVIQAPLGLDSDGVPHGMSPLYTQALRIRRQSIQESVHTAQNWTDHLMGHIPSGANGRNYSFPENCTPDDLYNEVLKVLPKLEIFGHHEMSPAVNTVELQKKKVLNEIEKMSNITPEKMREFDSILSNFVSSLSRDNAVSGKRSNVTAK